MSETLKNEESSPPGSRTRRMCVKGTDVTDTPARSRSLDGSGNHLACSGALLSRCLHWSLVANGPMTISLQSSGDGVVRLLYPVRPTWKRECLGTAAVFTWSAKTESRNISMSVTFVVLRMKRARFRIGTSSDAISFLIPSLNRCWSIAVLLASLGSAWKNANTSRRIWVRVVACIGV